MLMVLGVMAFLANGDNYAAASLIGNMAQDLNLFLGAASATAIGGSIAYLSSWRFVYAIYGIGELVLALIMLKILKRDRPVTAKLNLISSYGAALTNYRFMSVTTLIFFTGFTVFGCFTYSGILIQKATGLNIMLAGLMLSLFGLGTVLGGRLAPKFRRSEFRKPYTLMASTDFHLSFKT